MDTPELGTLDGFLLATVAWWAHTYALVYPFVAGAAMACGLFIGLHGVVRLLWRWFHGYPTFYEPHEKQDEP